MPWAERTQRKAKQRYRETNYSLTLQGAWSLKLLRSISPALIQCDSLQLQTAWHVGRQISVTEL